MEYSQSIKSLFLANDGKTYHSNAYVIKEGGEMVTLQLGAEQEGLKGSYELYLGGMNLTNGELHQDQQIQLGNAKNLAGRSLEMFVVFADAQIHTTKQGLRLMLLGGLNPYVYNTKPLAFHNGIAMYKITIYFTLPLSGNRLNDGLFFPQFQ